MRREANQRSGRWLGVTLTLLAAAVALATAQEPTAADGWIELPAPGATTTNAFAVVRNPTMYDIYLVSATTEIAGKVEFRQTDEDDADAVREITVPAYGKLSMSAGGVHLRLVDLKRALNAGDSVSITLTTDSNIELRVQSTVRRE